MDVKDLERMVENDRQQQGMTADNPIGGRGYGLSAAFPALMRKVYIWMTMALVITGICAYGVAASPNLLRLFYSNSALMWGVVIAELALVFFVTARIDRLSLQTATLLFILYSALNGVMLSSIFIVYTMTSITQVFFITAATFGAMAVYGTVTKTDLSRWGNILFMALIGMLIALVVNMFLKSAMMDYVLSFIGVLLFTGLTAYDTQKIKEGMLMQPDMSEASQKWALMGALTLYLDFINLFLYLLRIFGKSDN